MPVDKLSPFVEGKPLSLLLMFKQSILIAALVFQLTGLQADKQPINWLHFSGNETGISGLIWDGNDKPFNNLNSPLKDFEAISDGKKVYVTWTISSAASFDYFTIEKSKDGKNFEIALMIKSSGNIAELIDYCDVDFAPFNGISYYRLKQTDYYGQVVYSPIISVNYSLSKNGTIIPDKAISFDDKDLLEIEKKDVLVVLRDNKGDEFFTKVNFNSDKDVLYALDPKNKLQKGSYLVIASSFNPLCNQKLVVK